MDRYMELAQKCRELRAEYERKSAELDPLRWKLMEAQNAAEAEWQKVRDLALTATAQ